MKGDALGLHAFRIWASDLSVKIDDLCVQTLAKGLRLLGMEMYDAP